MNSVLSSVSDIVALRHLALELGNLVLPASRLFAALAPGHHYQRSPQPDEAVKISEAVLSSLPISRVGDVAQAHHRTVALCSDDNPLNRATVCSRD